MTQQGEAEQANQRLTGGMIASLTGLAVLVIFAIQNRVHIKIHFLFWSFIWPLWVYTIVTAVFGALVWFGWGVMRRHRRRKDVAKIDGIDRHGPRRSNLISAGLYRTMNNVRQHETVLAGQPSYAPGWDTC